jgi:hypothetical protein
MVNSVHKRDSVNVNDKIKNPELTTDLKFLLLNYGNNNAANNGYATLI